jgi:hypothetical protein
MNNKNKMKINKSTVILLNILVLVVGMYAGMEMLIYGSSHQGKINKIISNIHNKSVKI